MELDGVRAASTAPGSFKSPDVSRSLLARVAKWAAISSRNVVIRIMGCARRPGTAEEPWFDWSCQDAFSLFLGALIAIAVCYPFLGGGRLYLLDWVLGPHAALPATSFYGLSGGLVAGLPFQLVTAVLGRVLGSAATWLIVMAFFPISALGVARLADIGWGSAGAASASGADRVDAWRGALVTRGLRRSTATLLYCVNPFVFDRLFAGQVAFLLGYALVPYAVASLVRSRRASGAARFAPALWIAAAAGCAIHYVWISGVLLVGALGACRFAKRAVLWILGVGAVLVAMTVYVLIPVLGHRLPVTVGQRSLDAFRTIGDPHLGLFVNVAGLYGFWRIGPVLAKDVVTGWPFILLAILIVVVLGARAGLRSTKGVTITARRTSGDGGRVAGVGVGDRADSPVADRRMLAVMLGIAGIAGYFLALGSQGPTGAIYSWAYFHLPFFDTMREPQKFSSLLALSYSVFFAWGVEELVAQARSMRGRAMVAALALALPIAYTPTLFGGLDGQVHSSYMPSSWSRANAIMGTGQGKVLFLPWHLYLSFPFTHGMIISNPAPGSFTREVISGDNIQLPGVPTNSTSRRSAFLQYTFADGSEVHSFGHLVAPLGVRWIILSKTVDWRGYQWLNDQSDLSRVLNTRSLEMWRNDASVVTGERTTALPSNRSPSSWPQLLARHYGPSPSGSRLASEATGLDGRTVGHRPPAVVRRSPVDYTVPAGAGSWVVLPEPYQPGWRSSRGRAVELARGNMAAPVGKGRAEVNYGPWGWVLVGYAASGGAFFVLLALVIASAATRRRRGLRSGDRVLEPSDRSEPNP